MIEMGYRPSAPEAVAPRMTHIVPGTTTGGIYGPILFRKGALRRGQRDRTAGIYPACEWEDHASLALMECALFLLIRSSASWAMSPSRFKKSWSASCAITLNQPLQS
jgi:hypothetical protein